MYFLEKISTLAVQLLIELYELVAPLLYMQIE
jgi:hypothetical protein